MTPGNGASRIKRGRVSWILVQGSPHLGQIAGSVASSLRVRLSRVRSLATTAYRKEDLIEVAGCEFLRKQIC